MRFHARRSLVQSCSPHISAALSPARYESTIPYSARCSSVCISESYNGVVCICVISSFGRYFPYNGAAKASPRPYRSLRRLRVHPRSGRAPLALPSARVRWEHQLVGSIRLVWARHRGGVGPAVRPILRNPPALDPVAVPRGPNPKFLSKIVIRRVRRDRR